MFHATLEELEVLKVEPVEERSTLIPDMFKELKYYGDIRLENEIGDALCGWTGCAWSRSSTTLSTIPLNMPGHP